MEITRDIELGAYLRRCKIDPALTALVECVAASSVAVSDSLKEATFQDQIGNAGTTNVQGEDQKILDILADRMFRETCAGQHRSPQKAGPPSAQV